MSSGTRSCSPPRRSATCAALHGDKAVWKLIERHPERVERIDVDRELPRDVDTWEDYEAALSVLRRSGPARAAG